MAQTAAVSPPATRPAYGPLSWAETLRRPHFWPALALAAGLALFWVAIVLRVEARTGIFLWADQYNIFTRLDETISNPLDLMKPWFMTQQGTAFGWFYCYDSDLWIVLF